MGKAKKKTTSKSSKKKMTFWDKVARGCKKFFSPRAK